MFGGYGSELLVFFSVNALLALGVYITWSSGQLSAAHPALGIMAGYASGYFSTKLGLPTLFAAPAGVLMSTLIGTALAFPALRLHALYLAIATLGFSEVVAVFIVNTPALGGAFGFSGIPLITTPRIAFSVLLVVVIWFVYLERSRMMVAFRAVRDNPLAAEAMGVSVLRVRVTAFALGSALSGVSGVLYAHYVGIVGIVDFSFARVAEAVMMVAIGGTGIFLGPLLGAAIFTYLPEMLRSIQEYRLQVFALLLIAIIVWRPQGLISRELSRKVWNLAIWRRSLHIISARFRRSSLENDDSHSLSTGETPLPPDHTGIETGEESDHGD